MLDAIKNKDGEADESNSGKPEAEGDEFEEEQLPVGDYAYYSSHLASKVASQLVVQSQVKQAVQNQDLNEAEARL